MKLLLQSLAFVLNKLPKSKYKPIPLCDVYYKHGIPIPNLVGHAFAPTVTTQAVTSITQTTATGNGNMTDDGKETPSVRAVCYKVGTGQTPTTSDSLGASAGSGGTGAFTSAMTGLTAGTTYSVRAYATNSAGTAYGSVVEFTTTAIVAPTVTTDATPSSITTTGATFDTNNITATGNANATVRGVCYVSGSGGTPTTANSTASASGSFGTGTYSQAITGLSIGTTYSVRAYATNSAGTGYGATVEVTTISNVPPTVALNNPADTVATYYFDGSDATATDPGAVWTNDANAFDGLTSTSASVNTTGSTASNFLLAEGTNAPITGGAISQVLARVYATTTSGEINPTMRAAIYTNALGELLGTPVKTGAEGWGSYTALSTPSGGWTWQKVNDLEVKLYRDLGFDPLTSNAFRVEIEVTSIPQVSTTPTLEFTGTDAQSDDIRYNVQVDTVNTFNSGGLIDKLSNIDPGFANTVTPADTDPFNSGEKADYDVQAGDILTASTTYYWRARGLDPAGSNTYGAWATTRSFTTAAAGGTTGQVKIKSSGTFGAKPVKYKSGGTFSTGAVKYKSGGTFTETN